MTTIASTGAGPVRGRRVNGVLRFLGVPYAQARRWHRPTPPDGWRAVRDASRPGPICPQIVGAPLAEEAAMLQRGPADERCQTLNIWTPALDGAARPVMVWFHGGGFGGGSGGAAPYDGRRLCARQDVVLVTVTHRLGPLGFLAIDRDGAANAGLHDCVAALRWVRENIAGFGGDPGCVTLFGQSAGAAKIAALLRMPAATGLFHRAILQSAAALDFATPDEAAAMAHELVARCGVDGGSALDALPPDALVAAAARLRLRATADGRDIVDTDTPSRGIPLLCGTTAHEATFFTDMPLVAIGDQELREQLASAVSGVAKIDVERLIGAARRDLGAMNADADNLAILQYVASLVFTRRATALAEDRVRRGGGPVFHYRFAHRVLVRGGALGATHTAEIPYVFDSLAQARPLIGRVTSSEQALADRMSACWAGFARTGMPGETGRAWPRFDLIRRTTMVIDEDFVPVDDPTSRTRQLLVAWKRNFGSDQRSYAT